MSTLTEFTDVPVIDVTGLLGDDPHEQWRVAQELGRAAREVGFLQVTGTGIDPALFEDLLRASKAFFDLPREVKMQTYIGSRWTSRQASGWSPTSASRPSSTSSGRWRTSPASWCRWPPAAR
jgi:isopenicillin N synthase-like dioxygenase